MINQLKRIWHQSVDGELNLYYLSPPSKKAVLRREKRIAEVIEKMGRGYLLHTPLTRVVSNVTDLKRRA